MPLPTQHSTLSLPEGFVADWDFQSSTPSLECRRERFKARLRREAFPQHRAMKRAAGPRDTWVLYFIYASQGRLTRSHRCALARFRDLSLDVHVVCAAAGPEHVPTEILDYAQAVTWKALQGYDISAYTIGLREIATHSPGATVFVQNDSVFGPDRDIRPLIDAARWDLTGLTAQSCDENHLQTYAFVMRDVRAPRLALLDDVLHDRWSWSWGDYVVACQETRLARVAAQTMSVGAFLYADSRVAGDPMLDHAFRLIDLGLPFLKKSLVGKMSHHVDVEQVIDFIVDRRLI